MKRKKVKRTVYKEDDPTDEDFPSGKLTQVPNFLPPPSELAKAKVVVKVTIGLDLDTIQFFKKAARKHKTKYQRMIRQVLDQYMEHYRAA